MPHRIYLVAAATALFSAVFLWHGLSTSDTEAIVAALVGFAAVGGALFWLYWIYKKPGK